MYALYTAVIYYDLHVVRLYGKTEHTHTALLYDVTQRSNLA